MLGIALVQTWNSVQIFREPKLAIYRLPQIFGDIYPICSDNGQYKFIKSRRNGLKGAILRKLCGILWKTLKEITSKA